MVKITTPEGPLNVVAVYNRPKKGIKKEDLDRDIQLFLEK